MRLTTSLCVLTLTPFAAAQWTQLTPTAAPSPRVEPAMAFHASANQTLLFGGRDTNGFQGTNFNDTWAWDGLNWTQLSPTTSPSVRQFAGMAYDPVRDRTVLYGGQVPSLIGANYLDDTWEWDGTDWTIVPVANTPGGYIGNSGLAEHAMAYDLLGQRMVIFGGEIFGGFVPAPQATMEFDGTNWVQTTPAVEPPRRSQASMCTATTLGGVLMFGGTNFNNPPGPLGEEIWDDTWVYSALTDTWTQLLPTGTLPTARAGASLLFDSHTNLYVLHGGYTYVGGMISPLADTWTFDGVQWTDVTATFGGPAAPHIRFASADGPGGCHVMFGGSTGVFGTLTNDTWVQGCVASTTAFGAGCSGSFGVPTLSASSTPSFGTSMALSVANLDPAAALAFMTFGFNNGTSPLGPLPANLQPFGLGAGCELLVSADATLLIGVSSGVGSYSFAVPNLVQLAGFPVFFQAGSIDAAATGGIAVSNGLQGLIGY